MDIEKLNEASDMIRYYALEETENYDLAHPYFPLLHALVMEVSTMDDDIRPLVIKILLRDFDSLVKEVLSMNGGYVN